MCFGDLTFWFFVHSLKSESQEDRDAMTKRFEAEKNQIIAERDEIQKTLDEVTQNIEELRAHKVRMEPRIKNF